MNIFVVDDNPSIRKFLIQFIPKASEAYRIIGVAASVEEALLSLEAQNPDLLILDVELPDGKSFDILQKLKESNQGKEFSGSIIFVTAHDHYALKAIKYSALDYLLKPIDPDALKIALLKAEKQIENKQLLQKLNQQKIEVLEEQWERVEDIENTTADNLEKILLSDSEKLYLVLIDDIIRCESNGNYTTFYLNENRVLTISKPIKIYEQLLPKNIFYRVHRSHLVNLNYFDFMDKREGGTIHLKDGSILPVAIRRKDILLSKLKQR